RDPLVRRHYHTRLSLRPKPAASGEVGRPQRYHSADRRDNRWRDHLANTRASERKRMTEAPSTSRGSRSPQRTVVVASSTSAELVDALKTKHIDVATWPRLHISEPDSFASLDEAIENLFGYDWIIFVSETAIAAFLDRFRELGHEISELDSVRVCA